ncbi:beta-hexosaminidase [Actinomadura craniellae]|uniref:beta-N-acetylhexosaminidase n=1 Tax=Actinomadura craniellae TaxID=2231787 RepID=A0A365H5I0_9ACTN|nr:glycoside hydrolase family 3 protein [Actinomadura craniellae]RAY14298.1 beta-hexosaminidase [Actinomadura craniellae]
MRVPRFPVFPRATAVLAAAALLLPLAGCTEDRAGAQGERRADSTTVNKPAASWVPGFVAGMSVEEKVGQLFVPAFRTSAQAQAMVRRYKVGGFIYFPNNARTPRQTAELSNALQEASEIPLLIGVDEEQGAVSRLPYITRLPGNMALGATRSEDDARAAARMIGTELRAVGINQDYAPVADVNVNPANPVIGVRSYGSDPELVARYVGAAVSGFQDAGVAATAKHFPGHGDTATDSHTGLPVIKHDPAQWERLDAPPFRAAIRQGVDAIMSAHIVVPGLDRSGDPATLSPAVLTGLLRGRLGFQGVAVTDSLQMAGARRKYGDAAVAVRAVQAGADQLLMPPDLGTAYAAVLRAVRSGAIPAARLDEAVTRVLRLKERRGLFGDITADPDRAEQIVGSAGHRAAARRIAERSVTLVKNSGGLLPLRGRSVHVAGPRADELSAALGRAGARPVADPAAADVRVLTTISAGAVTDARLRQPTGRGPMVLAAMGTPYDLRYAGRARAALATYSSGTVSTEALARVMTGAARPSGRLPVEVPGAYRLGHGMRLP